MSCLTPIFKYSHKNFISVINGFKFCVSLKGYFTFHTNTLPVAWEKMAMKFFYGIMI